MNTKQKLEQIETQLVILQHEQEKLLQQKESLQNELNKNWFPESGDHV